MRILVEHGTSRMDNLGDIAMLQVAISRLQTLFPNSSISVVTRSVGNLSEHFEGVTPIRIDYPHIWFRLRSLASERSPTGVNNILARLEAQLSQRLPAGFRRRLSRAVDESDLVIHAGSGIFADPFVPAAIRRLNLFDQAIRREKPTAILGQGIGPLGSPQLRRSISRVLPKVDLLCVRDPLSGRLLTDELQLRRQEMPVTGDDALELALSERAVLSPKNIGFNVRLARYSGFDASDVAALRPLIEILTSVSRVTGGQVTPIVIDRSDYSMPREVLEVDPVIHLAEPHPYAV
jgi:polysaccharide pyruvyl transferase WcaK-like protein